MKAFCSPVCSMVIWGFFHDNGIDDDNFHCYWYGVGITGKPYFFWMTMGLTMELMMVIQGDPWGI